MMTVWDSTTGKLMQAVLLCSHLHLDLPEPANAVSERLRNAVQDKKWFRWKRINGFEGVVTANAFHFSPINDYTSFDPFAKTMQAVRVTGHIEENGNHCRVYARVRHGWHFRIFVWALIIIMLSTVMMHIQMLCGVSGMAPHEMETMKTAGPGMLLLFGLFWYGVAHDVRCTQADLLKVLNFREDPVRRR